jgi:hypothetical protein
MWRDATTMISNLPRRYYQKFAAAATITGQDTILFIKTLKTDIYSLKNRGSLKLKKMSIGTMASHMLSIDTTFDPC